MIILTKDKPRVNGLTKITKKLYGQVFLKVDPSQVKAAIQLWLMLLLAKKIKTMKLLLV